MPLAGEIAGYDPDGKLSLSVAGDGYHPAERDTSFVCVIDKWGNCFAATPSDVNSTAPVIPGTGLSPSPRGSQSFEDPSHPASLAPRKRPRLTPNPAIAIYSGQWAMPFGTPGNDVQVQAMAEVLLNIHLHRMSVQSAINAPRFATMGFPQPRGIELREFKLLLSANIGLSLVSAGCQRRGVRCLVSAPPLA
jgi:gamma-glutamyltranspeptidase/glutathione hydrolase